MLNSDWDVVRELKPFFDIHTAHKWTYFNQYFMHLYFSKIIAKNIKHTSILFLYSFLNLKLLQIRLVAPYSGAKLFFYYPLTKYPLNIFPGIIGHSLGNLGSSHPSIKKEILVPNSLNQVTLTFML
jgi:hypothetical protein